MADALFVVMPFNGLDSPHLGVSLLKAQLRARGIHASVAYLNFALAEAAGYAAYQSMVHHDHDSYEALAGEWVFSRSLFQRGPSHDRAYLEDYLLANRLCKPSMLDHIRRMAELVEPFLDYCERAVDWDRYSIIGFTSTFQQNLACLALARRIKDRFPGKIIVMGGDNCSDVMGVQLHESFPFLDYVFTGDADAGFPELASRVLNHTPCGDDIPGYVRREGSRSVPTPEGAGLHNMDELSYPDFDDYFAAYRTSPLRQEFVPFLQMETARGCWWGAKQHCTFCGLNQTDMAFRAKSPQRALDEMIHLVARYGSTKVVFADNIISMEYFRTFLPELKRRKIGVQLAYETKANLTREQVQLCAEAGLAAIQPGIESLSENVLKLMRKGVTPLQNVQLLKWCREYGVLPYWNVLYGFPGETAADYEEMCRIASKLAHLPPPLCGGAIRVERFSPYFDHAADFGIRDLRAHASYAYVYPFNESELYNLAYIFDFTFEGKELVEDWAAGILGIIENWGAVHAQSRLEVVSRTPERMLVSDTRPNAVQPFYQFDSRETAIFDACDRGQTFPNIVQRLSAALNGSMPDEGWIAERVRHFTDCDLLLEHNGRYLNLIVDSYGAGSQSPGT